MHAGRIIRQLRISEELSQREVADRVGVARTYLAQIESGKREPGLVLLRAVARVFNVPVALLLASDDSSGDPISKDLQSILISVLQARSAILKQTP